MLDAPSSANNASMDQLEHNSFRPNSQEVTPLPISDAHQTPQNPRFSADRSQPNSSQRAEIEPMDYVAARKIQKADREKLRRDRLNEHFVELGNVLDPDRPKNDKGTILSDTIQLLKELTSQVSRLKDEYATLSEESRELTQEKNDLREEKASLKSDIESLNLQYQQRLRTMFPFTAMDHSVVITPPSYPYPVPVPVAPGPIPMHPSMQPYPFFANQNHGVIPNPCSTYVPYITPNPLAEQQSAQFLSPQVHHGSWSHVSGKQGSKSKSSRESKVENSEGSHIVTTDLELKTPGSTPDQDLSSGQRNSSKSPLKKNSCTEATSSSRCSSSQSVQGSSSNTLIEGEKSSNLEGGS